jgi:hypothetical protein
MEKNLEFEKDAVTQRFESLQQELAVFEDEAERVRIKHFGNTGFEDLQEFLYKVSNLDTQSYILKIHIN